MSAHKHPSLSVLAILTLIFSLPAAADGILHARVSFESGGALVKGTSDDDWSFATLNSLILPGDDIWVDNEGLLEMEFAGGTFLRAADQSRLRVTEVPPQAVLEGTTGSFYVQRVTRSTGSVLFKTPAADIVIDQDTHARIDVVGQGATTVTVRWGEARVLSPAGSPSIVRAGQRVFVDPGFLPSAPVSFNRNEMDAFDTWAADRARALATGGTAVPSSVPITPTTMGYHELASHGTWVYVDNTPYWRPTVVVDYVPYRSGHWSYSRAYGYTWVGNHSFCYVTSHYGRWRHHPSHGWIWTYRETWAPAWVFSARYGSNYIWAPLDPWDRPVSYGSAYFNVGSHRISIHASSFAPVSGHYYGPVAVRPLTPTHVTNINVTQINIWNIYGGGSNYSRSPRYSRGHLDRFTDSALTVRDYNPRRSIRGPEVDSRRNVAARSVSERLQQSTRASTIEQGRSAPVRSIRTPQGASRTAQVRDTAVSSDRSVRVTPQDSRTDRRAIADTPTTSRGVRGAAGAGAPDATPDRSVRAPSAGERPVASRSTPVTGSPGSRAVAPDSRSRGVADGARTREVTAPPTSTRNTRTVDSISTTPGARPDAADRTRGVRGSTLPEARGGSTTPSRAPAARSTEPSSVRQPGPQAVREQSPQVRTQPQQQSPSRQPIQVQPRQTQPRVQAPDTTRVAPPSRQAPTAQRTPAPSSAPQTRSFGSQRQAPAPQVSTPTRTAPSRQPVVQQPNAPSTRSVSPAPSRSIQAPTQSAPQQRSIQAPTRSAPQQRSIQAPTQSAPQQRSIQAPTRSAPQQRSIQAPTQSAPQQRSIQAPTRSAPQQRSIQAPTRSAPQQRSISAPAQQRSISTPAPSRAPSQNRAVGGGGASRGTSERGR